MDYYFIGVMCLVGVGLPFVVMQQAMRQYVRREAVYLKIIRSLENRLSAKDLAGFMALESEDQKAAQPAVGFARDDEAEARIAAQKTGEY